MNCDLDGHCWCVDFTRIPIPKEAKTCLCPECLKEKINREVRSATNPAVHSKEL